MSFENVQRKIRLKSVDIYNRVDHITDLLALGYKRFQILADPVVESWKMSAPSVDKYIRHAKDDLMLDTENSRELHLMSAVLNLKYLYKVAITDKDYRLALDIQKEFNRLLKLSDVYKPLKEKEITSHDTEIQQMIDSIRIVNEPIPLDVNSGRKSKVVSNA